MPPFLEFVLPLVHFRIVKLRMRFEGYTCMLCQKGGQLGRYRVCLFLLCPEKRPVAEPLLACPFQRKEKKDRANGESSRWTAQVMGGLCRLSYALQAWWKQKQIDWWRFFFSNAVLRLLRILACCSQVQRIGHMRTCGW